MMGDNLTVLHWNLRQHDLLDDPKTSEFYLTDEDFFRFLSDNKRSLALHPGEGTNLPTYVQTKQIVSVASKLAMTGERLSFKLRGDQHLIIKPKGASPAEVHFRRISARGKLITYRVFESDGAEVGGGVVSEDDPLVLNGADYYHVVLSADTDSFMIEVRDASWAVDGKISDQGRMALSRVLACVLRKIPTAAQQTYTRSFAFRNFQILHASAK